MRTVVRPLGLTSTWVRPAADTGYPEPHPRGYSNLFFKDGADLTAVTPENWESMMEEPGSEPLDVTEFNTAFGGSAGNVVSTTSDMIQVVGALASGSLLPAAQHQEMWTTVSTDGAHWMPHSRYGLGVFELDGAATGGPTLRGAAGSLWGHFFFAVSSPDGEHVVAAHTNTEWKSWEPMFEIIRAEFGEPARD